MARKVQVHLLDDIDGSAADETILFALDGVNYEIDLSASHAEELRSAVAAFIGAARKPSRAHVVTASRARTAAATTRTDRDQNQAIRAWAKTKKIALSDRGRIPRNIVEQYEAQAGR
jgi:hypothetical protein